MNKKNLTISLMLSGGMLIPNNMTTILGEDVTYEPGVTIETNTTHPEWNAKYLATFVYEDTDERDATDVTVQGGFQFYKESEVGNYQGSGDNSSIPCYDAFAYEDGMFAGSMSTQTNGMIPYEMKEIEDEVFLVTLPLPANQYFYGYTVTYADGTKEENIKDPNNMPEKSPSGSDAGWSLFYVGTSGETKGQEYIYPRDGQNGNLEYKAYTAIDGSEQYIGVYTPYNYDASKTYKTIYVSHGGGGNEEEWMSIGSIPNIMDNLIAEGMAEEAIVVTMNNQYFGWDYEKVLPNILDYIMPFVEENYNVSKRSQDRAMCGLSMGSMTTNQMAKSYPSEFGYFGSFSGGSTDIDPTHYDVDALNKCGLYLTAGNIDMAYNNTMGISSVDYIKMYDELGVNYTFELLEGSHDWYVWRESFTNFVKDHVWTNNTSPSTYQAGVTVENNTNDAWNADYQATFVYEDTDERDAVKVSVSGNLQFYAKDDEVLKKYDETRDFTGAKIYSVYEYADGMFNTGYGLNNDMQVYELTETADERFEITLPLPGNLYYYDYTVTYDDGTSETIQDPVNPSLKNEANGHDAGHSLVYVGNSTSTTEGQEYIYAREDGKTGTYSFVSYEAVDGTVQPLGVYLPYNYDASKTYKTIYVSHGGGGNENEWMTIGAVPNIMDNLLAYGEVADSIVVTMDNTYFKWNYDDIKANLMKHIIPYVEENYSVSTKEEDRAFCGLSAGGMTTTSIYSTLADQFGYFGIWSGTNGSLDIASIENADKPTLFLAAGYVDFGKSGFIGSNDSIGLLASLDKAGIDYDYVEPYGAHDWGVWRELFTTFAKDYLWDVEKEVEPTPTPEVTPTPETSPTPSTKPTSKPTSSVKTSDTTDVMPYALGTLLALVGFSTIVILRKRSEM